MKYYTHYRGYMIFKKPNGCFCLPSINTDLDCKAVKDTRVHIDAFIRKNKMDKVEIPFSLRCVLLNDPILN